VIIKQGTPADKKYFQNEEITFRPDKAKIPAVRQGFF